MIRIILSAAVITGSLFIFQDVSEAKEKCRLYSNDNVSCRYDWKKEKSKLRTWAAAFCQNKGYARRIKNDTYIGCNKRGKKCRMISAICVKR